VDCYLSVYRLISSVPGQSARFGQGSAWDGGNIMSDIDPTAVASPARRRRILLVVLSAVLVTVAALVATGLAWSREHSPRLVWPSDGGAFGMSLPYSGKAGPWFLGGIPLCTDRSGVVQLTRLVPQGGNGQVRVVGLATRPHIEGTHASNNLTGASQRTLEAEGFPRLPTVVAAACPPDFNHPRPNQVTFYELAIRVDRAGPGDATFASLRVDYVSAGHREHMNIPWSLKLCGPAHATNKACGDPPEPTRLG
jgi:hypothetical protein